jgi:3-oxoacyl-[acyl-carrier protein] reductase
MGKAAIITGASAGLGRATALAFAEAGAKVVATARRLHRLEDLQAEIVAKGGVCETVAEDAALASTAKICVDTSLHHFGRLDILINNAGLGMYRNLVDTTDEDFDLLLRANLRSGFVFAREAARMMLEQKSGQILFISSVAGIQGAAQESVYSATKFAQLGMAQSLDAELRLHGIKVGAFCPGGMKTEFAIGTGRNADQVASSTMMSPEDVAPTLVHLCSLPSNMRIPLSVLRHMG